MADSNIAPKLKINTLGGLSLQRNGDPITELKPRKAEALVVYLACTQISHPRETLAEMFWGDRAPGRARGNLRVVLTNLRKHLAPYLTITRETVAFNQDAPHQLDCAVMTEQLAEAESLIAEVGQMTPDAAAHLAQAVDYYQGEFLHGFYVRGAGEFEHWLRVEAERMKRCAVEAMGKLVDYHLTTGDYQGGIRYTERLLQLEPLREDAHRQMMHLLAFSGQRDAAMAQYEQCRELLWEELGMAPSEETTELYDRLLAGELPGPPGVQVVTEREPRAVGECPYRGLAAFRETDAPFFFGREEFTDRLIRAVKERHLVAVIVGSSGSGKSSTVYAGLVPHLRAEAAWQIVSFRPGIRPFQALAAALISLLEVDLSETDRLVEMGKLAEYLQAGQLSLFQVAARLLKKGAETRRLLLVIDQFEELYTLCPDEDMRRSFLDMLLSAVAEGSEHRVSPFSLLLTLRADFMGQALAHRPFADALQDGSLILGPMNRAELKAAIEKPAEMQGAAFETGLVARLLDDVGEEPGNLPLLEFALTLLWDRLDYGWVKHAAYEQIGRVEGALARYAEEVYGELTEDEKGRARQIFVQLVQPGEGTEDTRRVAGRADFGEAEWGLIQHLADKRLVVTGREDGGDETAEVVHEALIRSWERLKEWMDADRAFRTWQEGLRSAMRSWEESQRDDGALLRGGPLATTEDWLAERGDELAGSERRYIRESQALRKRRERERDRRRRNVIIGLASGLVITLILALLAGQQWRRADIAGENAIAERAMAQTAQALEAEQRVTAEANAEAAATARAEEELAKKDALIQASIGLGSQALQEMEGSNPELAVLLALEAVEKYPYTWQAERALGQAVLNHHIHFVLKHEDVVDSVTWSPSGNRLATASWDGTAKIWDAKTGEELFTLSHEKNVDYAGWSPDGNNLLTISADLDGSVKIWDTTNGQELTGLSHIGPVFGAEWSPAGDHIALSSGNDAIIWDWITGETIFTLSGHSDYVWWIAWSPSGDRLATASDDGTAKIWDATSGEELFTLANHTGMLNEVTWSPSGDRLASASNDGTARVWDTSTGEELLALKYGKRVTETRWSRDGSTIIIGGSGFADLWDTETGERLRHLYPENHVSYAWLGGYSPDGESIVTYDYDSVVRVWDASTGDELVVLRGHDAETTTSPSRVAWSPSGDRLATSNRDGTAIVWDISPALLTLGGHDRWVWDAAWSPEGDRIVTTDNTHGKVWDATTGEQLLSFPVKKDANVLDKLDSGVEFVAWSPDGDKILTIDCGDGWGNVPSWARVFDAKTGTELVHMSALGTYDITAAWFPDGERVLIIGDDTQTEVWDVGTGENLLSIDPIYEYEPGNYRQFPTSTALSPDGKQIVTTYWDGMVKVYEAASGNEVMSLDASDQYTRLPSWSPDGRYFFTHSNDDVGGRKWDALTGELEMTFPTVMAKNHSWSPAGDRFMMTAWGTEFQVIDAKTGAVLLDFKTGERYLGGDWSPDGSRFVVGSPSGVATVFPAWSSLEELIAYAKECCVIRELTPDERELFGLPPQ